MRLNVSHFSASAKTGLYGLLAVTLAVTATVSIATPAQAKRLFSAGVSQSVYRANQLFKQGNYSQAEAVFNKALKANPNNLQARSGLALVQAEQYKLSAAEKNAQQVLSRDSKNPAAHIAMGKVLWYRTSSSDMTYRSQREGLLRQAEQHFNQAMTSAPDMPEAATNLGRIYQEQGRSEEARQSYEAALTRDPDYEEALVYMSSLDLGAGNTQQALKLANKAIASHSKSSKAHYYKGAALAQMGDYHEALNSLNTALYLEPKGAHVLAKMADIYQAQGNQAAAVTTYRKAIQAKPEYAPAITSLANLLQSRGDGELALSELRSAMNVRPNYMPFQVQSGQIALQLDKVDVATDYFNQALQQDAQNPEALRGLASSYLRSAEKTAGRGVMTTNSDLMKAEDMVQEALRHNPDDIQLHLALLKLQKATGDQLDTATLEQLASAPATGEIGQVRKSEALLALGRYTEADAVIDSLSKGYGSNTSKLFTLADTLTLNGDTESARRVYNNVLAQNPGNVSATRGLNRIGKMEVKATDKLGQARSNNHWYSVKDRNSAKAFYLEALEFNPRLSEARMDLGKLYEREDAYDKAIFEYNAYLQLNPTMAAEDQQKIQRKIQSLQTKLAKQAKA
jgi:tetratricopeptide (TPR) repeat protein